MHITPLGNDLAKGAESAWRGRAGMLAQAGLPRLASCRPTRYLPRNARGLIPSLRMRARSVWGLMPRLAATPKGPSMRP